MTIIRVENLSKKYVLSHQKREPYSVLRDVISEKVKAVGNTLIHPFAGHRSARTNSTQEEFWALRDVSFNISQGDRIGIIGRNGAGKSTLLKILSRITEPTTGQVTIKGRVASLLEVGTGFHPELTGRENIFLNGAILGMSRLEIKLKFDEIVAFAEVERFLDTPVKHYSSGMYVRLAFAVAAHLEPEVLIVDEVLAVGDIQFQNKCLGKIQDVSIKEGRTVLFVSHNLGVINALCNSTLLLEKGVIRAAGETSKVISEYLGSLSTVTRSDNTLLGRDGELSVISINLLNQFNNDTLSFSCDEIIRVRLVVHLIRRIPGLYGYLEITNNQGERVLVSDTFDTGQNLFEELESGEHELEFEIPPRILGHGEYFITLDFSSPQSDQTVGNTISIKHLDRVLRFTLNDFTTKRGNTRKGYLSTIISWKLK